MDCIVHGVAKSRTPLNGITSLKGPSAKPCALSSRPGRLWAGPLQVERSAAGIGLARSRAGRVARRNPRNAAPASTTRPHLFQSANGLHTRSPHLLARGAPPVERGSQPVRKKRLL